MALRDAQPDDTGLSPVGKSAQRPGLQHKGRRAGSKFRQSRRQAGLLLPGALAQKAQRQVQLRRTAPAQAGRETGCFYLAAQSQLPRRYPLQEFGGKEECDKEPPLTFCHPM